MRKETGKREERERKERGKREERQRKDRGKTEERERKEREKREERERIERERRESIISIHINFYQNQFINECVRKKKQLGQKSMT